MAKQVADVEIHAEDDDALEDDNLDVSVDLIDDGVYLGNLACARDDKALAQLHVTHVLTIDLVPLPRSILDRSSLNFEYVKMADVPKEDLISHLPKTNEFIKQAVANGGIVLVHCYFGVSRSAAIVIAYIMQKYGLCYEEAFTLVKSKRRFIGPNVGFVAQLKLFGHMGCTINKEDPRYKQFRLKMAGQKLKQVKILPHMFLDLVKPDPGVARERPEPRVYRCRRCRRVVAHRHNLIPHLPRDTRHQLAKKGMRPPPSNLTGLTCPANDELLIEKLRNLAMDRGDSESDHSTAHSASEEHDSGPSDEGDADPGEAHVEHLVDAAVTARADAACRLMWFVEPMAWMQHVTQRTSGKLHCPKCTNKIGSFNWVMGCQCPCGQKVAPAFYLVPSKVELSNIVQNVQITI